MLLTIDVGNTNTVFGVFDGAQLKEHWRIETSGRKTADEYGILLHEMFGFSGIAPRAVDAVAVASVVPPLNPDVAVVHAQRADAGGNAHLWGILGEQKDAAFAAKRLILTVEEIVPEEVIRSDPNRTLLPDFLVSAVVEEPWASHPSYVQGYYDRDNDFYIEWDEVSKTHEGVVKYLEEWVYGVKDRRQYVGKLGSDRLLRLRPGSAYSVPVNYGVTRGEA